MDRSIVHFIGLQIFSTLNISIKVPPYILQFSIAKPSDCFITFHYKMSLKRVCIKQSPDKSRFQILHRLTSGFRLDDAALVDDDCFARANPKPALPIVEPLP